MKAYNIVTDPDEWAKIQAMGDFEQELKNGELWSFNGELYYLSHLELNTEALIELAEFQKGPEAI